MKQEQPQSGDEINVAPLIDIVFILLIFFVVTTTFARDLGLEIDRPKAGTGVEQSNNIVRVAIDARRQVTVDGRPTSHWRLEDEVKERLSHYVDKGVLVVSDGAVEAAALVEVMDACRKAGAAQVALAVEAPR